MVRTRFAPSPTGYLHIGGVRTALFNWLFARHHGGQFILRIDDTDQQRNIAEALQPILDGFRWLGIDWDEGAEVGGPHGPYYQSQKRDRYQAAVRTLLERGHAYQDEATGVVRLRMPREGVCRFHDHIRGDMEVEWAHEADHVIQRADGSCLYNLASVVDDHDMAITHVIRAEEHLSNTPRQIFIARGLGYEPPEFAHVPFVAEPGSKRKLSKRELEKYLKNPDFKKVCEHGQAIAGALGLPISAETFNPVIVDFYARVGYLPDAVVNYLLLLGWSLDDKTETFSRAEMIAHFSLERVNKAAASFDAKKLWAFQERYMALVPLDRKVQMTLPYLEKAGLIAAPAPADAITTVTAVVRAAGERIKVAGDILEYAYFFLPDDRLPYDEKAFAKHVRKPEANALLRKMRDRLATAAFDPAALEAVVQDFAQSEGVKVGEVNQPLRVAVTGKDRGFGTYETLALLGRERCLARIDRALARP